MIFDSIIKKFLEMIDRNKTNRKIRKLNRICSDLANDARIRIDNKCFEKLRKVMEDRDVMIRVFFNDDRNFLKEKIVEQGMRLIIEYIKTLTNFSIINKSIDRESLKNISTKLDHIEHAVSLCKNQVLLDLELENNIEDIINEVEALDTVLESRRKSKVNDF